MEKKQKKYLPLVIVLLLLTVFFALFFANRFSLEIQLHGEQKITLEYGEFYEELGANMVLSGKFLLKNGMIP